MALDSGIAKMGIFAFVFLIAFVGIMSLVPSGFNANLKDYSNPASQIPEYWNGVNLLGYNFTEIWNTTLTKYLGDTSQSFEIGGRDMTIDTYIGITTDYIRMMHRYGLGLIFHEDMFWYNQKGIQKSYSSGYQNQVVDSIIINDEYKTNNNLVYKVLCKGEGGAWLLGSSSYYYVTAILTFNQTLYNTPDEAWDNDELDILIGIDPQNISVTKDIWALISALLSFNTLEIFGTTEPFAVVLNWIACSFIYGAIVIFVGAIFLELFPDWL